MKLKGARLDPGEAYLIAKEPQEQGQEDEAPPEEIPPFLEEVGQDSE
jgi:hypothetical protein